MTHHGQIDACANRVPPLRIIDVEPFSVVAFEALAAVARSVARDDGLTVCAFPDCSTSFAARRADQLYCSTPCKAADVRERRSVGLIAAPALLAGRIHKHAKPGSPGHALCIVARRYVTEVQTEWMKSRNARIENAQKGVRN